MSTESPVPEAQASAVKSVASHVPWHKHPCFWMVIIAFVIRITLMYLRRSYVMDWADDGPFSPLHHDHFAFGFETGAVARSLADGDGFSNPFGGHTGPTTWIGPVYPAILAVIFKLFGIFSPTSGVVILSFNILCSALTCIPLYHIGMRTLGEKAAILGGWIWACGAGFMEWPVTWVWDMALSALFFTCAFLFALKLVEERSLRPWALWGAFWGLIALTNPSLLTFLLGSGLWLVVKRQRTGERWLRECLLAAALFFLVISPWLVRNRMVFGDWVFIRGNAGFELSMGNYKGSNGLGWFGKHPTQNKWEYAKYKKMGEKEYVAFKKDQTMDFIRVNKMEFAELCAKRFWDFWYGTYILYGYYNAGLFILQYWPVSLMAMLGMVYAWWERRTAAGLFTVAILFYPLPYYITFAQTRYRHAIEPLMCILGVFAVYAMVRAWRGRTNFRWKPLGI